MGIDAQHVLTALDRTLKIAAEPIDGGITIYSPLYSAQEAREFLSAMSAQDWVSRLAATPDNLEAFHDQSLGARGWLLNQLDPDDGWDVRRRLRAVLLSFPDAEVALDVTWPDEYRWPGSGPGSLASNAQGILRNEAAAHAPMVVLTEGRNDTEFLNVGLMILYPHLSDLVRFLDYERKPEGGASAALRMVRAFDAAGIANRVVAVLDNDTAAANELRLFDRTKLSDRIRVLQYPTLELAQKYPTLGPPTVESPSRSIALADVNGLAASIELYLGRDVLAMEDGSLRPVQWKSFIAGMGRYQGEVTEKHFIHEAFRTKASTALQDSSAIGRQDWDGIRLILDAILTAFVAES
jgi:hypothetical protein